MTSSSTTGHTPATGGEWVTRADAAKLANCNEKTIARDAKTHKLEERENASGAKMVRPSDLVRIGRISAEALKLAGSGSEAAELLRARDALATLRVEAGRAQGRLDLADRMIESLTAQLREKDLLISKLMRIIEAQTVRNGAAA